MTMEKSGVILMLYKLACPKKLIMRHLQVSVPVCSCVLGWVKYRRQISSILFLYLNMFITLCIIYKKNSLLVSGLFSSLCLCVCVVMKRDVVVHPPSKKNLQVQNIRLRLSKMKIMTDSYF